MFRRKKIHSNRGLQGHSQPQSRGQNPDNATSRRYRPMWRFNSLPATRTPRHRSGDATYPREVQPGDQDVQGAVRRYRYPIYINIYKYTCVTGYKYKYKYKYNRISIGIK